MNKLTKIVNPSKIFMGEKDFQQLFLVKKLLERKYKIKVMSCKTIRDSNKVALSSRNFLLNKSNLLIAAKVYEKLTNIKNNIKKKNNNLNFLKLQKRELKNNYKIKIDYLELRNINNLKISNTKKNSKLFIAYYIGNVRLIDNI